MWSLKSVRRRTRRDNPRCNPTLELKIVCRNSAVFLCVKHKFHFLLTLSKASRAYVVALFTLWPTFERWGARVVDIKNTSQGWDWTHFHAQEGVSFHCILDDSNLKISWSRRLVIFPLLKIEICQHQNRSSRLMFLLWNFESKMLTVCGLRLHVPFHPLGFVLFNGAIFQIDFSQHMYGQCILPLTVLVMQYTWVCFLQFLNKDDVWTSCYRLPSAHGFIWKFLKPRPNPRNM